MNQMLIQSVKGELLDRRHILQATIAELGRGELREAADLTRLLVEVDNALERLDTDAFARCRLCGDAMDDEEMLENPMRQFCLCDLSPPERAALQRDLDLAWSVQASLLPAPSLTFSGWQTHYRFLPAGPVSGDYCDLITHEAEGGWLYFLLGDVSGKGVAASYVMAHLSALVRRTLDSPVSVECLMETVNRHLSDRSVDSHFVTLVAGRAHVGGRIELANAGHCRPVVLSNGSARTLDSTGIPVGIAGEANFATIDLQMDEGDSLILYSDGVSESMNGEEALYGDQRLADVAAAHASEGAAQLVAACLADVKQFRQDAATVDDTTLMVLRRT